MRIIKFRCWDIEEKRWVKFYEIPGSSSDKAGIELEIGGWAGKPVMQFTGLFDKQGKEIWEGDIVLLPGFNEKRRVFMSQGMFCVAEDGSLFPLSQFYSGTEVIGNIFENSELLEKKK